jgi:16S rRNA G966 N2-methylase RsmD
MRKLVHTSRRYLRYAEYFLTWLFLEKPRGLDFSMRAKAAGITAQGNHGYALTSRKALTNILRRIPISEQDSFLDIGCGKAGVVCYASDFPFGKIAGIEVESWLVDIARKNVKILNLDKRANIIHEDALKFNGYGEYNVFFLFNPFDLDIYAMVLEKIFAAMKSGRYGEQTVWLLCYGASNFDVIKNSDLFDLYIDGICPYRGNLSRVWKSKSPLLYAENGERRTASSDGVADSSDAPAGRG